MVCSRSGVRLYAAAPRSGPGLLCAAARFVSAMYVTVLAVSDLPSSRITSLLEGLEFTPPSSARTKGDIYVPGTWYAYQHFLFDFPFDEIYVSLLFFTLGRSFYA